ncbi:MAG: alpha/beta hydrolase [Solirubrobacterales bacterium]
MPTTALQRGVCVEAAGARLAGWLYLPPDPKGLVIFASSRDLLRIDRRQIDLSEALNERGLGTLLFDLVETTDLAEVEGNVGVLAARLIGATGWSRKQRGVSGLPLGYVGSGLGSAAALSAAAALVPRIRAVVSHGGRPDLAGEAIEAVQSPTLLLADAEEPREVTAARAAAAYLPGPHRVHQVRNGASRPASWAATPAICRWMEWHLVELEALP